MGGGGDVKGGAGCYQNGTGACSHAGRQVDISLDMQGSSRRVLSISRLPR